MTKIELLKMIGNGVYGSEIPNDDATTEALTECVSAGLILSEPSRMDDFFFLTQAGQQELPALYRFLSPWFTDQANTELFLDGLAKAGFKIVRIDD